MKMRLSITICSVVLLAAVACSAESGDPGRVFNLDSLGSVTEAELAEVLDTIVSSPPGELQCAALGKLSSDEAVEALEIPADSANFNRADAQRLVQLWREECEDAYE